MEEVEMRVWIHAHAVVWNGRDKSAIIPRAICAELKKLPELLAPFRKVQFCKLVTESVPIGGKSGIPLHRPGSVIARIVDRSIPADYVLLASLRMRLFNMSHERHDDGATLFGSQSLPYPVIGAERHYP